MTTAVVPSWGKYQASDMGKTRATNPSVGPGLHLPAACCKPKAEEGLVRGHDATLPVHPREASKLGITVPKSVLTGLPWKRLPFKYHPITRTHGQLHLKLQITVPSLASVHCWARKCPVRKPLRPGEAVAWEEARVFPGNDR